MAISASEIEACYARVGDVILPGATIGILGGGQLGRMTGMAARSLGAGDVRILALHIFPRAIGPIMVQLSRGFSSAILVEAGLTPYEILESGTSTVASPSR